jgi:hypothetical protein
MCRATLPPLSSTTTTQPNETMISCSKVAGRMESDHQCPSTTISLKRPRHFVLGNATISRSTNHTIIDEDDYPQQFQNNTSPTKIVTKSLDHNPKRRRVVQFSKNIEDVSSSLSSHYVIDEEVLSAGWYNRRELGAIKSQAREICQRHTGGHYQDDTCVNEDDNTITTAASSSGLSSLSSPDMETTLKRPLLLSFEEDDTTTLRGLETRICPERQRRKYLVGKFVLTAASKLQLQQPHHVAKLAWATARVTRYASRVAHEEALRDYHRVYGKGYITTTSS